MIRGRRVVCRAAFLVLAIGGCHNAAPSPSRSIRVMTYNIQSGGGNLDGIAQVIREAGADIAALQEVDVHWSARSGFVDEATALAKSLGMDVRFAPIYNLPGDSAGAPRKEFGVALLTKYPVVRWQNLPLTRLSTQTQNPVPAPAPGFLDVVLDINGKRVRFYTTHLDYRSDPRVRAQQVSEMLAYIRDDKQPVVLLGDMNGPPTAAELQPLFNALHDAWSSNPDPGFTYPSTAPVRRIDYVLLSPGFRVLRATVPATTASDHRPVIADLEIAR